MSNETNQNTIKQESFGKKVTGGLMWMLLATFITKGGSFAAQIVLGWILLKEDFGIYAIAMGISSLVQILKDGGTRKIIVQKGERRFHRLCPAVFWMASGFNIATALVMFAVTIPVSRMYDQPQLIPMLLVLATSTLVGTPDTMYRAWLSVQLRFKDLARLQVYIGIIRSSSMILLALSGAGAMSFAWPALITVLCGWLIGNKICGPLPIWGALRIRLWPILLHSSLWMFVGSAALMMLRQGPYLILGLYHDPAVVGVYFFAFQLLLQINQMIAINFQSVLLPTLSTLGKQANRHTNAVVRASGALTLIGTALAMGVCVGIGDVVRVIWGEKWIDAILAIQWMGLFFPFRMLQSIFEPALISKGLYKKWATIVILQAMVVLIATIVATTIYSSADNFAMTIGTGFMVSMVLAGWIGSTLIGVSPLRVGGAVLPVWIIGAIVYSTTLYARHLLGWNTSTSISMHIIHGVSSSLFFVFAYVSALRIIIPKSLIQLQRTLPDKHADRVGRILLLQRHTQS